LSPAKLARPLSDMIDWGMEYQVTLTDGGALTYADTMITASDDAEAREKCKAWVATLDDPPDGAWLVLNAAGRLFSLKPGTF
jgi:hypothetical protein